MPRSTAGAPCGQSPGERAWRARSGREPHGPSGFPRKGRDRRACRAPGVRRRTPRGPPRAVRRVAHAPRAPRARETESSWGRARREARRVAREKICAPARWAGSRKRAGRTPTLVLYISAMAQPAKSVLWVDDEAELLE